MRPGRHLSHFQALSRSFRASTHALEKSSQPKHAYALRTAAEPLPSLLREGRHVQQSKACLCPQDSSRAAFRSSGCKHVHPLTNFAASSEPSMPMPSGLHKSFLRAGACIRSQTSPHQANQACLCPQDCTRAFCVQVRASAHKLSPHQANHKHAFTLRTGPELLFRTSAKSRYCASAHHGSASSKQVIHLP